MPVGFDHIVIAVKDLDQTTKDYTEAGFTVTAGGEHKGGASANVLVTFQDGVYFELIAFKGEGGGTPDWREKLETSGEGLVDYALRTNDLDAEIEILEDAGLDVLGPYPGGRFRPDGQRIDWRNIRFGNDTNTTSLPFFCFDETERSLRVPDGDASVHANGVDGVKVIRVVVTNIEAASTDYESLTGELGIDVDLAAPEFAFARQFAVGNAAIELVQPSEVDSPLRTYLHTRGEKPFNVVLSAPGQTERLLSTDLTHGARLHLQG